MRTAEDVYPFCVRRGCDLGMVFGNIQKVIDCYDVKTWGIPVVCFAMTSIHWGFSGVSGSGISIWCDWLLWRQYLGESMGSLSVLRSHVGNIHKVIDCYDDNTWGNPCHRHCYDVNTWGSPRGQGCDLLLWRQYLGESLGSLSAFRAILPFITLLYGVIECIWGYLTVYNTTHMHTSFHWFAYMNTGHERLLFLKC